MKRNHLIYLFVFLVLVLQVNCQDDDYDTDPEEAVQSDYAASEQPEFFKNAFAEGQSSSRQSYLPSNGPFEQYMPYFPIGGIGDGRSAGYPPFYPLPYAAQSYEQPIQEHKPRSEPMNDDFFDDHSKENKDKDFESNSFQSPSKPKSMNYAYKQAPMMPNYAFHPYAGSAGMRYSLPQNQITPYQHNPYQHPIGSHLFPHTQERNKKTDHFDEELKKLGIDLEEFGLGGGGGEQEKNKEKKEDKKKKKKNKKIRPLFPSLLNTFKPTTTESPIQNQYLKSNVENDISNLGFNMDNYGIKEHKIEKQVYGDSRYQYPMQANLPVGYPNNANYNVDPTGGLDYKAFNNLNEYSEDKLNSLMKLAPTANDQTILPAINSNDQNTINPVFTADAGVNNMNANDIAAINLLENTLNDLNSYSGKAHEYRHSQPEKTNDNFAPSLPISKSVNHKSHQEQPKVWEDEFFKEPKSKPVNHGDGDYEPENRKKARKVVYKLNSEVRSNKYFESVTPKPKSTYDAKSGGKESSDDYEEDRYKVPQYNDDKNYSKNDVRNYDKDSEKNEDKNDDKSDDKTMTYSKEFSKDYTPNKYKFGYRYYDQKTNHEDYENKQSNAMRLMGSKETNDKSPNETDDHAARSNEQTNEQLNNQEEDRNNEKGDGNESYDSNGETSTHKETLYSNSSANAYDESGNNANEDKVDEELSGSRRRYARSITNLDYFRSVDRKLMDNLNSNKNVPVKRRHDSLETDSNFEDSEEHLIDDSNRSRTFSKKKLHESTRRNPSFSIPRLQARRFEFQPVKRNDIQRRKHKIVSFDEPPGSYQKRKFEIFDNELPKDTYRLSGHKTRRPFLKSLNEDFNFKPSKLRLERRKCSNASRYKHRAYDRDDTDIYSQLSKNPLYKHYQHL